MFWTFDVILTGIEGLLFSNQDFLDSASEDEEESDSSGTFGLLLSLIAGVVLVVVLPQFFLNSFVFLKGSDQLVGYLAIGMVVKVSFLLFYLFFLSFLKGARKFYQKIGAINQAFECFRSSKDLTIENAEKQSLLSPGCVQAYLLFLVFVGTIVFSYILPTLTGTTIKSDALSLVVKFLTLFFVFGVSFEYLYWGQWIYVKNKRFGFLFLLPFLGLQRLIVRKPSALDLTLSLGVMRQLIRIEKGFLSQGVPQTLEDELTYQDLSEIGQTRAQLEDLL